MSKKEGNITNNNTTNPINRQAYRNSRNPTPATALLPPGEGSNSLPAAVHLPPEDASSSQQIGFTPTMEENNSSQATTLPTPSSPHPLGHPKQGNPITSPGQAGKAIGTPQATTCTTFPGGLCNLPGRQHYLHPTSRPIQGSSWEEPNPKWVINLSNKPLTPAQMSVLAKGPNFVVTPRQPPNLEYITAIEAACTD